ncbi:MAG: FKBP-type peptidyl-prolyl cis-trans isomerase [Melioribacteraceae bacterium]|mgnify:CR=1 FL=1|nr:FKBP-type peptidyl-prolyl cis-trans isomerase [Melioribacteraceae bacterium]
MSEVKKGDKVQVHYTGKLGDGSEFDSSKGREPLEFEVGSQQVIKGFEEAVVGLKEGDTKTVDITSNEAYGPRMDEMVLKVEKSKLPEDFTPQMGQQLQLPQENGQNVIVTVTEITDDHIELDANHPLAGKDLTFDIELVKIV